jgi:hypothetical protein
MLLIVALTLGVLCAGSASAQSGAGGASLLSVCPKKVPALAKWTAAASVDVTDLRFDGGVPNGESAVYRVHLKKPLPKPESRVLAGELIGACATTTVTVETEFGDILKPKLCADAGDCDAGDTCEDTRPVFQDTSDNAALILSIFDKLAPAIETAIEPQVPQCAGATCDLCIRELTRPNFANIVGLQPGRCQTDPDEPCFVASDCGGGGACQASQASVSMTGVVGRAIPEQP